MRAAELGSERPLIAARARERESLFREPGPLGDQAIIGYGQLRKENSGSLAIGRLSDESVDHLDDLLLLLARQFRDCIESLANFARSWSRSAAFWSAEQIVDGHAKCFGDR